MTHKHQPKQDALSEMHEYRGVAKNRLALAMTVTGAVMVLEVLGSFYTGSLALGSDAGHMFTHLFALAISFVAISLACKEPCHHRTTDFTA
jgi:cobalt-zinc-cadmium efflux system protein